MNVSETVDTGDGWRGESGATQTRGDGEWSLAVFPDTNCWRWTAIVPHGDWYKSASGWCYREVEAKKAAIAVARGLT